MESFTILALFLLLIYADNLCKEFGPRSSLTNCLAKSVSKNFDFLMVFMIECLEKVHFEKNQQITKNQVTFPSMPKALRFI